MSNVNIENVTDMEGMFSDCYALTSINLSNWNARKVDTMQSMFSQCKNLTSLELSGFVAESLSNMSGMFTSCEKLQSLDLSGFDMGNLTGGVYLPSSLRSIKTPTNLPQEDIGYISLIGKWVDAEGNFYKSIPSGMPESIELSYYETNYN